jgi:ribonuclease BN (tRNA processing enzyme)
VVDALFSRLHPTDGTMIYRIAGGAARLVFATDVEIGAHGAVADQSLIEFARGADALVHDAQYSEDDYHGPSPKRGYGHSTPAMAARIATAADVDRLVLFHHDPHYSDAALMELQRHAQTRFPEVLTAREGLELRLDGVRRRLV